MAALLALFLFLSAAISAAALEGYSLIKLSSYLTPTSNSWVSHSGTFAFGFHNTEDGYVVCIFCAGFKERTVVWTANRENPIVPDDVVLLLTEDGLVLQRSDSHDIISRIDNSSQPIAGAEMHDNGNFVLYNSNHSVIWQSFDHPTDSLLPGQRLPPGGMLLSRASETDIKTGIFRLRMQYDANLVLYYVYGLDTAIDAYYSTNTYGHGNVTLNLENDGHLYLFDGFSVVLNLTTQGNHIIGTIYLARLDWDGILRLYSRSLQQEDRKMKMLIADAFRDLVLLMKANGAPAAPPILGLTAETHIEERCKQGCLDDCNCIVAFFKDGECRKQKLPLSYGKFSVNATDMAFVRVISSVPIYSGKRLENYLTLHNFFSF